MPFLFYDRARSTEDAVLFPPTVNASFEFRPVQGLQDRLDTATMGDIIGGLSKRDKDENPTELERSAQLAKLSD